MDRLISLIHNNLSVARIIWFSCGLTGFGIFYKTRREFYESRSKIFTATTIFYYIVCGPLTLISSLISLTSDFFVRKRRRKEESLKKSIFGDS